MEWVPVRSAMPVEEDWSLLQASPPVLVALIWAVLKSLAVIVESVIPKEKVESRMPAALILWLQKINFYDNIWHSRSRIETAKIRQLNLQHQINEA